MNTFAFRLTPGQDLRKALERITEEKRLKASVILTCVAGLESVSLRLAGAEHEIHLKGEYEVVSCVGTLSGAGIHVHISVADDKGRVWGGHLKEGCIVRTTAEVVVGELEGVTFARRPDPNTGFDELEVIAD